MFAPTNIQAFCSESDQDVNFKEDDDDDDIENAVAHKVVRNFSGDDDVRNLGV